MKNELIAGSFGTALSVVGTATQVNETLQTISLVLTIIGALISFILVPLLNWYKDAKKDGKISPEEIKGAAETLEEGINKVHDSIAGSQTDGEDKREEIKRKKKGGLD